MISGLFLAQVCIDRDWRTYLDRKVVHFFYFYLLWMTLQFVVKAPVMIAADGAHQVARLYLLSLIDPFGTLWFIYQLPIFFVVVKLARRVPVALIWGVGAALEIAHIQTGWMVIDEFAARFVYFYTGYILAKQVFAFTANAQTKPWLALGGLALWGVFNGVMVHAGYAPLPFFSLALGLIGAAAVATISALMALHDVFRPLRCCGRNSSRHLSRLLPADGGDAHHAGQDRIDSGCRCHVGDHYRRRRIRLTGIVLGGARHLGRFPV